MKIDMKRETITATHAGTATHCFPIYTGVSIVFPNGEADHLILLDFGLHINSRDMRKNSIPEAIRSYTPPKDAIFALVQEPPSNKMWHSINIIKNEGKEIHALPIYTGDDAPTLENKILIPYPKHYEAVFTNKGAGMPPKGEIDWLVIACELWRYS